MRRALLASITAGLLLAALIPAAVTASSGSATVSFVSDNTWTAYANSGFTAYNADGSTTGLNDLGPAVEPTYNTAWTASIPGATWIWASGYCDAQSPSVNQFATFVKTVTLNTPVIGATLSVAADNDAEVFVNGNTVATVGTFSTDPSTANQFSSFQSVTTVTVPKEDLHVGDNTISVVGMNFANGSSSCLSNPAAVLLGGTITVDTAPTVTGVTLSGYGPLAAGSNITVSATYTDPDPSDPHTATIDCGNGTTLIDSQLTVTEPTDTTPGTVTGICTYPGAGVYTVSVTVTDSYDLSGSGATTTTLVIYDPSAGFVTGGGRDSANNNFGFVAKYQSGGTVPVGSLEYQYADGNFHSNSFSYLLVNNGTATLVGTGTLDGVSGYSFTLNVTDTSPDELQITISGPSSYSYSSGTLQAISKGSIQIHS